MADDFGASVARRSVAQFGRWQLWSLSPPAVMYLLAVELLAVVLLFTLVSVEPLTRRNLVTVAVLVGLSVCYAEVTDRVERLRRFLGNDLVWSDRESVWTFAAVLLLPIGYAAVVVVLLYAATMAGGLRHKSLHTFRHVFTASTVVLGCLVTGTAYHAIAAGAGWQSATHAAATVVALVIYTTSTLVLLLAGVFLATRPPRFRLLLPGRDEVAAETAALTLGAVAGVLVAQSPWLTPSVLVLFALLHRSALIKQLQLAATTDSKTGLLNAAEWHELASRQLAQGERHGQTTTILLIDIDHFKLVNDRHGHLAGDRALRAVADCLKYELRGYDSVGRFGGEEFVVCLPGVDGTQAHDLAERLRSQIATLGQTSTSDSNERLSVSIGLATSSRGSTIETLLSSADVALYEAKATGRNRVVSK